MKEKSDNINLPGKQAGCEDISILPEYPLYPESEDIFNKSQEQKDINPEDISKVKTSNDVDGTNNEKDFDDDTSGSYLDVSGSELDDDQDNIGSEDEENYSLGGDNHENLDEVKGE